MTPAATPVTRSRPPWSGTAFTARGPSAAPGLGWVVVGGGLAFLLGRPGLHGLTFGLPLLTLGWRWGGRR